MPAIAIDKQTLNKLFELIMGLAQNRGAEAQRRIAAHIRHETGLANIAIYHAATNISNDAKAETYRLILLALGCKAAGSELEICPVNYSLLKGKIGNGDKPIEEEQPKRADPLDARPPTPAPPMVVPPPTPPTLDGQQPKVDVPRTAGDLAEVLARTLEPLMQGKVNEDRVRVIAREEVLGVDIHDKVEKALSNGSFPAQRVQAMIDKSLEGLSQRIVLVNPDGTVKDMGRQHFMMPLLAICAKLRLHVALSGPAGTSKTTSAATVAGACDLAFETVSVGPMTSKADLMGYMDANGKYRDTALVRRATEGGVFMGDEWDAGHAGVGVYPNAIVSNDVFGTPDGMRKRHKDFVMILGMNTWGMGANRIYVGRNQMDGSTNDRFVFLDWCYDEGFEAHLVGVNRPSPVLDLEEGGLMTTEEWLDYVQAVRRVADMLAIRHVVSPRATMAGAKLFAAKVGRAHVERMALWKGLDKAQVEKIKHEVNNG
jgi:hypothetical protein